MPRVLRILNRFNLGGPVYNACYLTKYLAPEFETLLLAGMKDDSEASSEFIVKGMGLEPRYLASMRRRINFSGDLSSYLELRKIIKEFKPDIVHTHAAKSGALGRLAASHENVPVIVHTFHGHVFHSYFGEFKSNLFVGIERYLASKSSAIVAISDKQKQEIGNVFKVCPPEKIHVIPLGFELDRFRESLDEKRKKFRNSYRINTEDIAIGIIGRLVPVKNHKLFLDAFSMAIKRSSHNLKAVIIGDGELRSELEEYSKRLGLICSSMADQGNVIFTSWIKDIDAALPGLDLVAMSSLNEGTPVSLIEAQATGIPVLTTRIGGVEEVVCEGKSALISESKDVDGFVKNLLELTENKEKRHFFAENGWNWVKEKYHVKRLTKDMSALYRKLLSASK